MLLPQVGDGLGEAVDAVVRQLDVFGVGSQPDADAFGGAALFEDAVFEEFNRLGIALDVDADSLVTAAVDDFVALDAIAMSGECGAAFRTEEDSGQAAVLDDVVADDVVGVAMAD